MHLPYEIIIQFRKLNNNLSHIYMYITHIRITEFTYFYSHENILKNTVLAKFLRRRKKKFPKYLL